MEPVNLEQKTKWLVVDNLTRRIISAEREIVKWEHYQKEKRPFYEYELLQARIEVKTAQKLLQRVLEVPE